MMKQNIDKIVDRGDKLEDIQGRSGKDPRGKGREVY